MAQYAKTQAPDVASQRCPIVRHGARSARTIPSVMAGERLQDDGTILNGPGQRACVVVGERIRYDAVAADEAIGWFQADGAAKRGGNAKRATRNGTKCRRAQAPNQAGEAPTHRDPREHGRGPRDAR